MMMLLLIPVSTLDTYHRCEAIQRRFKRQWAQWTRLEDSWTEGEETARKSFQQ
jgi:hypothetical protein